MWNDKYRIKDYVYGTEPNAFLKQHCDALQHPVLSLGEGEGRNAVYLARQGFQVVGIDGSEVGLAKAQALAQRHQVTIKTLHANLETYTPEPGKFNSVISVFAHLPKAQRRSLHQRVVAALNPGGIILIVGYSLKQLNFCTGGPRDADMLYTLEEIRNEFSGCEILLAEEVERPVIEGTGHTGMACVIQFIAKKNSA